MTNYPTKITRTLQYRKHFFNVTHLSLEIRYKMTKCFVVEVHLGERPRKSFRFNLRRRYGILGCR